MLNKAIFLDLDGTVRYCKSDPGGFINKTDDTTIFDDVMPRLREYHAQDYKIFGVSNQGGIGLGYMSVMTCSMIMNQTRELMDDIFDRVIWCGHKPDEGCCCRKPDVGMVYKLACEYDIILAKSIFVGDMESDRTCALKAGIPFISAHQFFDRKETIWNPDKLLK